MEAGRELDVLVAKKVMGITCIHKVGTIPVESVAETIAASFLEEHGYECSPEYAKSEALWSQRYTDWPRKWCTKCYHQRIQGVVDTGTWNLASYSTDISAAWKVVEKMVGDDWDYVITTDEVSFDRGIEFAFTSIPGPAPLKICVAALKAHGIDVE